MKITQVASYRVTKTYQYVSMSKVRKQREILLSGNEETKQPNFFHTTTRENTNL